MIYKVNLFINTNLNVNTKSSDLFDIYLAAETWGVYRTFIFIKKLNTFHDHRSTCMRMLRTGIRGGETFFKLENSGRVRYRMQFEWI